MHSPAAAIMYGGHTRNGAPMDLVGGSILGHSAPTEYYLTFLDPIMSCQSRFDERTRRAWKSHSTSGKMSSRGATLLPFLYQTVV
jgi:hypothetical protein